MKQPVASPVSTEERDCRKLSPRRRAYEVTMRSLLYLCAGITCALLLFLIGYILYRGLPGLSWEFLTSQESILKKTDGILPAIQNTIYVIIVTLIFILPLGVGSAIYLTEYASNRKLVTAIEFATETLSGIPSIRLPITLAQRLMPKVITSSTTATEKARSYLARSLA